MKTFNEGDRVSHPTDGEGTIVNPYPGIGWSTVQFDNGKKLLTDTSLLTPVPSAEPVTFVNGDRVMHTLHGVATVFAYDADTKLVTIFPDGYGDSIVSVHPTSLTLIPTEPKFKIGDKVSNGLHRNGTVEEYDEHSGLYTVGLGGSRAYRALEHQITAAKPEPKFHVLYRFTHGNSAKSSMIPMDRQQTEAYLTNYPDWDTVESITITRAKG